MQARRFAVRSRSAVTPWNTGAVGTRSSRGRSATTATNTSGAGVTNRARPVFSDGRGDAPASARLVQVAPRERLEFAYAHPGSVQHDGREPVAGRQEPEHGLDVIGARRRELGQISTRESCFHAIASGIRRHAGVIENHRERAERLADRLASEAAGVELSDERRSAASVETLEFDGAELRQDSR